MTIFQVPSNSVYLTKVSKFRIDGQYHEKKEMINIVKLLMHLCMIQWLFLVSKVTFPILKIYQLCGNSGCLKKTVNDNAFKLLKCPVKSVCMI